MDSPEVASHAKCYALRYTDLMEGYCHGDVNQCELENLKAHWESHGKKEGRRFSCVNLDAKCYATRYPDIIKAFCPGKSIAEVHKSTFDTCKFVEMLQQWNTAGRAEGRTLECDSPETICYVQRNSDLLETYCHGLVTDCVWPSVIEHMVKHGEKEGRKMGCEPPSPPPPPPPPPRKHPPPSPSPTPPQPPPPPMVVIGANGQPVNNLAAGGASSPFGGVVIIITIGIVAMATVIYCFCRLYTAMMSNHEIVTAAEDNDDSHTGYDEEEQYYDDDDDDEFVAKKKKKKKSKKKQRETFSGDYD